MSQYNVQYSFYNNVESVAGFGRGGYMSQNSHSPSYNPGGLGIFLGLYVRGNERGGNRSQTRNIPSLNHVRKYSAYPRLPQDDFPRCVRI